MRLNREEKVALALMTTLGATAMDCNVSEAKIKEFEAKFGVHITGETVARVINKIGNLLSGSESVVISDD
jgi:hypothetical protein